jgi:hypothetical protein
MLGPPRLSNIAATRYNRAAEQCQRKRPSMPLDTIYVVQHTHTDVGFTNDQPVFWEIRN